MTPYTTGFNNNIIIQHGRAITPETMPPWESTRTRSSIEVVNNNRNIIMPIYQRLLHQEIPIWKNHVLPFLTHWHLQENFYFLFYCIQDNMYSSIVHVLQSPKGHTKTHPPVFYLLSFTRYKLHNHSKYSKRNP
jgi:hypothetical protein